CRNLWSKRNIDMLTLDTQIEVEAVSALPESGFMQDLTEMGGDLLPRPSVVQF
ncbi:hypothetical protein MPER_00461, partial [Moniliophthora perniciosa FA553]